MLSLSHPRLCMCALSLSLSIYIYMNHIYVFLYMNEEKLEKENMKERSNLNFYCVYFDTICKYKNVELQ